MCQVNMCTASVQGGEFRGIFQDAGSTWLQQHQKLYGDVLVEIAGRLSGSEVRRPEILSLWDWDDTLFPTSHMEGMGWVHAAVHEMSHEVASYFQELDRLISTILGKAMQHGRVVIVTNAGEGWVQLSSSRYLPRVSALLEWRQVEVVSAREKYYRDHPNFPCQWKVRAFSDELYRARDAHIGSVLVMGDSVSDQYAAHRAVAASGILARNSSLKFVKFAERPTAAHLIKQLTIVDSTFDQIVQHPHSFDVNVVATS